MKIGQQEIRAERRYKVAGWAPVAEGARGEPIWDVVARYLRAKKRIAPLPAQRPRLIGVQGNPGIA
jgi:sulfur-oxidizing protein SoxB